ncbi:MAG: hypothetical protein AAB262_14400 [Elusimicrobiota bacterium]
MNYWIFQSNQVLGPYSPEDLSRLPSFSAESLVCPEGRKGTSMGDWQRAGMVPDLSVALIKASSAHSVKIPVAALAGLPPEPTLKDLAVLGSLQEKVAMLEDVVLQLQEGLRVKDTELSNLHIELAGKSQQSSETEMRRREVEVLKAETEEFKRRIADLEERAGTVSRLSETIDKAVEAEKHVEHDVEVHASTIAGLTQEIESLRAQVRDRLAFASASVASAAPSFAPSIEPAPVMSTVGPVGTIAFDSLAPHPETQPTETAAIETVVAQPPASSRTKAFVIGGMLAVAALAGLSYFSGIVPGLADRQTAPDIAVPAPMPAPDETPSPEPAPDERQAAIDFTKQWILKNGNTLGQALQTLSPSNGNLSPWMAEPLSSGRVQVNYFARGSAPGSPTVAYEFDIDLTAKSLAGRNAAAKAVIAGKAAPPPAPKKAKPVKVKAKSEPSPAPAVRTQTPVETPPKAVAKPVKPPRAKRAAKEAEGNAEDASLLDDLLKE